MQLEYNYNLQLVCNLSTATKNQQLQRTRFSSSVCNANMMHTNKSKMHTQEKFYKSPIKEVKALEEILSHSKALNVLPMVKESILPRESGT